MQSNPMPSSRESTRNPHGTRGAIIVSAIVAFGADVLTYYLFYIQMMTWVLFIPLLVSLCAGLLMAALGVNNLRRVKLTHPSPKVSQTWRHVLVVWLGVILAGPPIAIGILVLLFAFLFSCDMGCSSPHTL